MRTTALRSWCIASVVIGSMGSAYPQDPIQCSGSGTHQLTLEGSTDGYSFSEDYLYVYGPTSAEVMIEVRTTLDMLSGVSALDGWSFAVEHVESDPTFGHYGGEISFTHGTIDGTDTENFDNPALTESRIGFDGYTQGVMVDAGAQPSGSSLFVSRACYKIRMPQVSGMYIVDLQFSNDVPGSECTVVENGAAVDPCVNDLQLILYVGYGGSYCAPGYGCYCSPYTSTPTGAPIQLQAPAVPVSPRFVRGDANDSGQVDLSDGVFILHYLYLGDDAPICADAADADDNGNIGITDPIYLFNHLFLGGPPFPAPHAECGCDLTPDEVSCADGHAQCADPSPVVTFPESIVSDQPFEIEVSLGEEEPEPVLVSVSAVPVGSPLNGELKGTTKRWVEGSGPHFLANLIYGPVESIKLQVSWCETMIESDSIPCVTAVEPDDRGRAAESGVIDPVMFQFRDDGMLEFRSGQFKWKIEDASAADCVDVDVECGVNDGSSCVLEENEVTFNSSSVTVPLSVLNGADLGVLHRVTGRFCDTGSQATYPIMLGDSVDQLVVTLKTGREGAVYTDDLTEYFGNAYESFVCLPEDLPPGVSLVESGADRGKLTGTPERPGYYRMSIFGVDTDGGTHIARIAAALAVFSPRDEEIEPGQVFGTADPGPNLVSLEIPDPNDPADDRGSFVNSWSGVECDTKFLFYYPSDIADSRRLPAICFLHLCCRVEGSYDEYRQVLGGVAEQGFIVVSVNKESNGLWFPGHCNPGQAQSCEDSGILAQLGYGRASGFQEAAWTRLEELNRDPSSALFGRVDSDNVFFAGHSRGGATTWLNSVFLADRIRGIIPIMPTDPRREVCLVPNHLPPDWFPPLPTLAISAERDVDATFAQPDGMVETALESGGARTHVTLYGAKHTYMLDERVGESERPCLNDGTPLLANRVSISREEEHKRIRHWIVAFLNRQALGDLRLEGQLYLNEQSLNPDAGTSQHAVYGRRDLCVGETLLVDDHENEDSGENRLGGSNVLGGSLACDCQQCAACSGESDSYHTGGNGKHLVLAFSDAMLGTHTWETPPGSSEDVERFQYLTFRLRQFETGSGRPDPANDLPNWGPYGIGTVHWDDWISSFKIVLVGGPPENSVGSFDLVPHFPVPNPCQLTAASQNCFDDPDMDCPDANSCLDGGIPANCGSGTQQRFHGFSIPLMEFVGGNDDDPLFGLNEITAVRFEITPKDDSEFALSLADMRIAVDDVRFE